MKIFIVFSEFFDYDSHDKSIVKAFTDENKAKDLKDSLNAATLEAKRLSEKINSSPRFPKQDFSEPRPEKDMKLYASYSALFTHPDLEIRRKAHKDWNSYTHNFKPNVLAPWEKRRAEFEAEQNVLASEYNRIVKEQILSKFVVDNKVDKQKVMEIYDAGWQSMATHYSVELVDVDE